MRFFLFLLFAAVFSASLQSPARANDLFYFFFPMLKPQQPRASQTLEAPFVDPEALQDKNIEAGLPENVIPLDLPHRSDLQIAEWLTSSVSESLSLRADHMNQDLSQAEMSFDAAGWQQFRAYLRDTKKMEILRRGQYDLQSFVDSEPLLLNKGAAQGSYKWLYEVSALVTYLPKGIKDYSSTRHEPVTQNVVVTLQVGRKENAETPGSVHIESWSGRVTKSSQKEL